MNRKEDYGKAKGVALEAAKSRAWLYPIKACLSSQLLED